MALLDFLTGGNSGNATDEQKRALAQLEAVGVPTAQQLDLPELQKEVNAGNMTPAQMQAYLQQNNALATENVGQTGTDAQIAALNRLAGVANQGAAGNATEQAQQAQIQQDMGRTLAGQRGAIEQSAQARGVPLGLLQAALSSTNAGSDIQQANQAALQAQSGNYQTALNAMSQGANVGQGLQGQQNTQANTVAQAQNAMQQFNAANQQNAAATNAGYQQQANSYNTQNAQNIGNTNTGLANQRTEYNAQVPETVFNNQMQKATGVAGQANNLANTYTQQGQQNAGLLGGMIGATGTAIGGIYGGPAWAALGSQLGKAVNENNNSNMAVPYAAHGGMIGDCNMKSGGQVPGQAQVPGDSEVNDTVHARLSPGEFVVPRSVVQNHPEDIAALLQAMRHLRGAR